MVCVKKKNVIISIGGMWYTVVHLKTFVTLFFYRIMFIQCTCVSHSKRNIENFLFVLYKLHS